MKIAQRADRGEAHIPIGIMQQRYDGRRLCAQLQVGGRSSRAMRRMEGFGIMQRCCNMERSAFASPCTPAKARSFVANASDPARAQRGKQRLTVVAAQAPDQRPARRMEPSMPMMKICVVVNTRWPRINNTPDSATPICSGTP